MAIGYDTQDYGTANTSTFNASVNNSASTLFVYVFARNGAVSAITYNSVSMTLVKSESCSAGILYVYGLINPATGTHQVSLTTTSTDYLPIATVYTGTDQNRLTDASISQGQDTSGTNTKSLTVIASNCWLLAFYATKATDTAAGDTGRTNRANSTFDASNASYLGNDDANTTTTPGSHSITYTPTGTSVSNSILILVSIAPAGTVYPIEYTLTTAVQTFILTGININILRPIIHFITAVTTFSFTGNAIHIGKKLITSVGEFIVTGFPAMMSRTGTQWSNQAKSIIATFTNQDKHEF